MSPVIGFTKGLENHPDLPEMFDFAWLEGPEKAKLARKEDVPDWNDPDTWPAGRLFGERGEYRWQRGDGNKIHAVLILDEGALPDYFNGQTDIKKDNEDSALILWGGWVGPESNPDGGPLFYAGEIPEAQTYPIHPEQAQEKNKTPRLLVRHYRHETKEEGKEQSKGEFIRCLGLDMRGKEKEAENAED